MFTSVIFRLGAIGMVVVGGIAALSALAFLTEATLGVGIIGIGCFMGICGRMLQAAAHQAELSQSGESRHSSLKSMLTQMYKAMQGEAVGTVEEVEPTE